MSLKIKLEIDQSLSRLWPDDLFRLRHFCVMTLGAIVKFKISKKVKSFYSEVITIFDHFRMSIVSLSNNKHINKN